MDADGTEAEVEGEEESGEDLNVNGANAERTMLG